MMLVYVFFLLSALTVLLSLILRVAGGRRIQFAVNATMLALLAASAVLLVIYGYSGTFAGVFSINPFASFFALVFTIGLLLVNFIAFNYSGNYQNFAVIGNFALMGMYVVASSTSLVTIFLGLELASIPMVFAVLMSKGSVEAAVKLFIMASLSVAVLSLAIVLLYGATGSLALSSYPKTALLAFCAILFIASLGIEASIFPFNVLVPDIYTGSPAYMTGLLGGVSKKVGLAALMQVLILIFVSNSGIFLVVAVLSVLTMTYGNIAALMQRNLKRMLAYSSISQAGYILIGIAVQNATGATASLFQILSHMFIFIGMMAIVAVLEERNRTEIDGLIGLNWENRLAAFSMAVFMLSLIGLPLTTGFVGKFLLFLSAVNSGMAWLAIIGVINSVISIFYYARAIMAMYTERAGARPIIIERSVVAVIILSLVATILFGIYPTPIISMASGAASFLYH